MAYLTYSNSTFEVTCILQNPIAVLAVGRMHHYSFIFLIQDLVTFLPIKFIKTNEVRRTILIETYNAIAYKVLDFDKPCGQVKAFIPVVKYFMTKLRSMHYPPLKIFEG